MLNNPMIYSDPSGEFIWFVVGAVIGAYVTGAKANGSFNPLKWDWKATGGQILLGAAFGAISGGVGAIAGGSAAAFAASSLGIQGGILGGAIAGLAGGAVGGAIGGLGNSMVFGESIGRGIVRGMVAGAIGGAVIGGVLGGIQTGLQNPKLPAGEKLNMMTGNKVAEGRSVWALNNTPKHIENPTTTIGQVPKVGKLDVGEMTGEFERTVGYKINPQTEQFEPISSFENQNPFIVTQDGVVLPRNAFIPENYIENPFRNNSYGIFKDGKFIEKIRIDQGTLPGFKGPNSSHFHIDGSKKHIFDPTKWPFYKK
ncbi:hypothetical protein MTP09_08070 [Chryseobacterium suipulveris]|uniref:Uncharacterized protein n=1 Tax=Chryseobacterium suipulveris TaxID=2929800 RepID=A0ABY4BL13_9FLAO|nr:hypothetical protein [Chryseobacterium suipulveris]UOE39882.1 hypothetical protein MTP09_08070 [Chryseobacterium suipulveris]